MDDWRLLAEMAGALVAFLALNLSGVSLLLNWHEERNRVRLEAIEKISVQNQEHWDKLQQQLFDLVAALPKEYVRREDWIRFGATIDAKLDATGERIAELKDRLYGD